VRLPPPDEEELDFSKVMQDIMDTEVYDEVTIGHILLILLGCYIAYLLIRKAVRYAKKRIIMSKAKEILQKRNAKKFVFPIDGLDIDSIVNLDVRQMREGLLSGKFTSVDLVNIYSHRCYIVGRKLNYTTQESYKAALIMAEAKDDERKQAIRNKTVH
jgi:hypothetical protein